jgi:hypothetical protein
LRSSFDWQQVDSVAGEAMLDHWRRLEQFRARQYELGYKPYTFARILDEAGITDRVVAAMTTGSAGPATIRKGTVFAEGTLLHDGYSGATASVSDRMIQIAQAGRVVLLEAADLHRTVQFWRRMLVGRLWPSRASAAIGGVEAHSRECDRGFR